MCRITSDFGTQFDVSNQAFTVQAGARDMPSGTLYVIKLKCGFRGMVINDSHANVNRVGPLIVLVGGSPFDVDEEVGVQDGIGEPAMQLNVPPDLKTLINKRLSTGGYTSIEDVLRRALEAQNAGRFPLISREGYLQTERGELIEGAKARRESRR